MYTTSTDTLHHLGNKNYDRPSNQDLLDGAFSLPLPVVVRPRQGVQRWADAMKVGVMAVAEEGVLFFPARSRKENTTKFVQSSTPGVVVGVVAEDEAEEEEQWERGEQILLHRSSWPFSSLPQQQQQPRIVASSRPKR